MLKLLLGGSGSGKTTLLYQRIRARAEAGEKSILLVPEQFTSSTEGRIHREMGDALSARPGLLRHSGPQASSTTKTGLPMAPPLGELSRRGVTERARTRTARLRRSDGIALTKASAYRCAVVLSCRASPLRHLR